MGGFSGWQEQDLSLGLCPLRAPGQPGTNLSLSWSPSSQPAGLTEGLSEATPGDSGPWGLPVPVGGSLCFCPHLSDLADGLG